MGTGLGIDGRNIAPLRRKIHAMRERAQNLLPAWQYVTDWFADQNRVQWGSRGGRWGQLWPELSPVTIQDKIYKGWPTDMMRRDRSLERSLTDRPLSIELLEPRAMSVGTRVEYAKYHQRGTKKMPKRILFSVEKIASEGVIGRAVVAWIVNGRTDGGDS